MIREKRSREKLAAYYDKFMATGEVDANVHPWVADSWRRSRELKAPAAKMYCGNRLAKAELAALQELHAPAISYLSHQADVIREFFQKYNISLLLLDADAVVLKSFSLPYYQLTPGEIEGVRVGLEEVGTSSISMALEHRTPFWLFGPEMWVAECQESDACSAPIFVGDELSYVLTLVAVQQTDIPQDAVITLLLSLKTSLEMHLAQTRRLKAQEAILDATPFAVYHVTQGGEVAYANKLGLSRLARIGLPAGTQPPNLSEAVLNYRHTPIYSGFRGVPSHNKEVTWITQARTYEDITTVVPLERDAHQEVVSVVVVSMPIEDLRTLVAHAAGYTAKYTLSSMVGDCAPFATMHDKAARVARNRHHVLVQGEPGTGKQRLAHGIHHASQRAAGPLITLRCNDASPELLEQELFGVAVNDESSHPGRLELASGGTLFLDEVEHLPKGIAVRLAQSLTQGFCCRIGETVQRPIDVRIIAACDSDLKRLTERGLFDENLYNIVSRSVIRVPALRSRREDIASLAEHIAGELAVQHHLPPKSFDAATLQELREYDWPGNIKQLQSVVEQAFFNTKGDVIRPADVSLMGDVRPDMKWKEDREVFVKAWQAAGGNVSRLANLLGVSRVTLYRYLKRYDLEKS